MEIKFFRDVAGLNWRWKGTRVRRAQPGTGGSDLSMLASGRMAINVARWDGSEWQPMGNGIEHRVRTSDKVAIMDSEGVGASLPCRKASPSRHSLGCRIRVFKR
jgi:hypothetical protein